MPFLAPAFAAVTAFASTALGSIIISTAISVGASLLSSMLTPKPAEAQQPGIRLSIAMGDTVPVSFPVGYVGTAGSRKYVKTWGQVGKVPNAFLTEVVQLSDLSSPGLEGFWALNQRCTILWNETPVEQGWPVLEFRVDGTDHMWVRFRTGEETTADPFLVSRFANDPIHPWTNDFIGRGASHAIVTTLYNRELFGSQPTFMFEPSPTRFYDLRKDSTNGGLGSHRWGDTSTYEPTRNPIIINYNIVRGIYYNGVWIYGGRNLPAFRLPPSSWIAAANECDAPRALAGGGTEPQFRCGLEINVDVEPLSTIELLNQSCNARMSEIGGIFEVVVGSPGAAVYSFTDANIVISRGQKYSSFPSLNDTFNAIEATYPEPGEMWAAKAAPSRYYAEHEAEDGGRRLASGITLTAVPYGIQAQQIMATLVKDGRRWRTHWITLPPDAWILTGTCVVNWTSARNGYVNKKFLVVQADGEPGMCQSVVLREIDPSDYAFTVGEQFANSIGNLIIVRPPAQAVTGFQAFPAIFYDMNGIGRRPTIRIVYDGNMPDIRAIHVLVRLKSSGAYVYEAEVPFAVPYDQSLNGVFLPNTEYEVAIKYVPFSGRPTVFTEYQTVLTDNIKLVSGLDFDPFAAVVGFDSLNDDLAGYLSFVGPSLRAVIEDTQALALRVAEQDLAQQIRFQKLGAGYSNQIIVVENSLVSRIEELRVEVFGGVATAIDLLEVRVDEIDGVVTAQAGSILSLETLVGKNSAGGYFRAQTVATEQGASSTIGLSTSATADGGTSQAALFLSAIGGGLSRVSIDANQFVVRSTTGQISQFLIFDSAGLHLAVADIGVVTAGILQSGDGKMKIDLNNRRITIST